jgi:hypothetical protein
VRVRVCACVRLCVWECGNLRSLPSNFNGVKPLFLENISPLKNMFRKCPPLSEAKFFNPFPAMRFFLRIVTQLFHFSPARLKNFVLKCTDQPSKVILTHFKKPTEKKCQSIMTGEKWQIEGAKFNGDIWRRGYYYEGYLGEILSEGKLYPEFVQTKITIIKFQILQAKWYISKANPLPMATAYGRQLGGCNFSH